MHVLVTGGAGFIGSHSVDALLQAGVKVRVLDSFITGSRQNLPSHDNLEICTGDIRNLEEVRSAVDGITHILHLAAQVSVQDSIANPPQSCEVNIQGFVNVLQVAKIYEIQRVVYASSAAVYGHPKELPLSEETAVQPISPYGLEKSINDQYASLFRELFGISILGLRYFNVYGPRQDPKSPYAGVISKFMDCVQRGQPLTVFGDGGQTRDFVFVKDVARANVQALLGQTVGICHVGTGTSRSLLDMIEVLSKCVGRDLQVVYQEAQPGDIPHSVADVQKLESELGIQHATEFQEGLTILMHEVLTQKG